MPLDRSTCFRTRGHDLSGRLEALGATRSKPPAATSCDSRLNEPIYAIRTYANPPLTTVRLSREELARNAFNAIQQLIDSEAAVASPVVRVGTSLIVRESTDFHTEAANGLQIKRRGAGAAAV